jgi:hypothetical protein
VPALPEKIWKLQPNRTLALRGFDDLGASAALHSATADSFKVSGIFRDPADFAVLILHDADNFYEHPRLKYLPDFDFSGLTLTFDVRYSGLIPLDSPKFETIDWPYLDVTRADGTSAQIRLSDPSRCTVISGDHRKAGARLVIEDRGLKMYDRLTLWYLNIAYDYLVTDPVECALEFTARGADSIHTVTVAGVPYNYKEQSGDTNTAVAEGVVNALASCPDISATRGDGTADSGPTNQVNIHVRRTDGSAITVASGDRTYTLYGIGASTVASALAAQINATDWSLLGASIPIDAQANGSELVLTARTPGEDGNMLTVYTVSKNDRLRTDVDAVPFTGGSSDVTWRIRLNFDELGIPQVRLMWLTFAPKLKNGAAFESLEWEASFSNWNVTGPDAKRELRVAGLDSVRIEETDSWCKLEGRWDIETGFFSEGYARRTSTVGDTATVRYACTKEHDLYIGTSLYPDRAIVGIRLDADAETDLDCRLDNEPAVNTRRRVRTRVPAGEHTVTIRLKTSGYFYLDFIEAAVPSDVPDAPPVRPNLCPALDYSTDHTYKLPPARILWMLDRLGFGGPLNEYIGVFWWNQRKRVNAAIPSAQITFAGSFADQDQIFIDIGGQVCGKTVFPNESNEILAKHFAYFINATYVGVWASAAGNVLTVTTRSPKPAYSFTLNATTNLVGGSTGSVSVSGSLQGGSAGNWIVDPEQSPPLNRGSRDWHADMFRECAARGRETVIATSMELVNPPEGFGAVFADGKVVETDVGFGSMKSTHCAFVSAVAEYQKAVYADLAGLMSAAGLTPNLQLGEFLWWFFTNNTAANPNGGMAFYHPEIVAAAQAELNRALHIFRSPNDDPGVNGGADARFLRDRLKNHARAIVSHVRGLYSNVHFEVLFPYDVNHPQPAGVHQLGGALNRFVNLPVEWEKKHTSDFDRIKMEALDFGAWSRNLDLAKTAIVFPLDLGWPRDSVRHLVPVFRSGYPWEKEVSMAHTAGIPAVNLWAFDHVCIYNLPVAPVSHGRSVQF